MIDDIQLTDAQGRPIEAAETPVDPADDWRIGTSRQLPRILGGHCASCAYWNPTTGTKGTCEAIPDPANADLVTVPAGEVVTDAVWGCNLHAEIAATLFVDPLPDETPEAFAQAETALMERTDLVLDLGLMPAAPEDFTGGGAAIERERLRREERRGAAA